MNRPEINVTPLIDVLLVLLIIFMVISPIKPSRLVAKAPAMPEHPAVEPAPLSLVVSVAKDGALKLNNENAGSIDSADVLIERLSSIFRERAAGLVYSERSLDTGNPRIEKTVFIKGSREIEYGRIAAVVDAVRSSGAEPVGLQIDDLD